MAMQLVRFRAEIKILNVECAQAFCRVIETVREAAEEMPWRTDMKQAADDLAQCASMFELVRVD